MTIDDVSNILGFLGGLGMFLYGMKLLSGGLQKAAGEKMKSLLEAVTNKRIKAILVGALVTAIIQSSGATTVMIVGFVNAGILNLMQAVGVIMGANIGTTVTAWIVSLGQIGDAGRPVVHLEIDVVVIVHPPGTVNVVVPNPLKVGRHIPRP